MESYVSPLLVPNKNPKEAIEQEANLNTFRIKEGLNSLHRSAALLITAGSRISIFCTLQVLV